MPSEGGQGSGDIPQVPWFTTTHWSVIVTAGASETPEGKAALEQLCQTYWLPLYAFVRKRGYSPDDAQDLTQEYFLTFLAKDYLSSVDRCKGRFRSFLRASMGNFLAKDWRKSKTQKRGAQFQFISVDAESAEEQYLQIASPALTPEQVYDREWAMKLFNRVVNRLHDEEVAKGKKAFFEEAKVFLTGEPSEARHSEIAARLQTTEAAFKMAVSRLKERYWELLVEEVGRTVSSLAEIEDELRVLAAILRS